MNRRNAEALINKVEPVWTAFAELLPLVRATRLLTNAEVEKLCAAAAAVSSAYRAAYPDVHIQLKIHIIESHLPKFARRWRSVGLFAEDACESMHAIVNRLNRRYACVHGVRKARCKREALMILSDDELAATTAARKKKRAHGPNPKE